ncbi:hypothetical protein DOTSEDRAFT_70785 [Dothistroma septosporum NZE10]|uniref:RRM domain-containing protein n=1 Tax=Dothistroma septosporum (strain NZE10 / CBS 128990) TaxID=675120 RepID=N1PN64_DOTSN|nr:hypothetical protein DOTSEDRAFT_70785 [Dothistroma septosporum NZE10]
MDRSLDEIIGERPAPRGRGGRGGGRGGDRRGPPPPVRTAPRREEYPRDGVRKTRRDEPANLDEDWTHDRYEDDRHDRRDRRAPAPYDDRPSRHGGLPGGTKIRVDNLHYELTEEDLRDLFERIGPTTSVRLLYDRADRSLGTAYVIYEDPRDARQAVDDFNGQMANGQPIRLQLMPSGPGPRPPVPLIDRMEKPPRSLFDRIEGGRNGGREDSREGGRRRRYRSDSPQKDRLAPPDVDRYIPGRGSRSPIGRRGTPREGGRRPGERRERGGGRGGRGGRVGDEGHPVVGGRPKKTAEELDAEMADYWSGSKNEATAGNGAAAAAATGTNGGDIDMDI